MSIGTIVLVGLTHMGQGGLMVVDVAGGADRAWDAALQPDHRLAVSGVSASISGGEPDRIALGRYRLD